MCYWFLICIIYVEHYFWRLAFYFLFYHRYLLQRLLFLLQQYMHLYNVISLILNLIFLLIEFWRFDKSFNSIQFFCYKHWYRYFIVSHFYNTCPNFFSLFWCNNYFFNISWISVIPAILFRKNLPVPVAALWIIFWKQLFQYPITVFYLC